MVVRSVDPRLKMKDVSVGAASRSDLAAIKEIENTCGLASWSVESYGSLLDPREGTLSVATYEGQIIGFCAVRLITKAEYSLDELRALGQKPDAKARTATANRRSSAGEDGMVEAELCNLGVLKRYRRLGVGVRLWKETAKQLRMLGDCTVFLEVRKSNAAAIAFYSSVGFEKCGRRPDYYRRPCEDAVVMRSRLPRHEI